MKEQVILRIITKIILPFMIVFGFYVIAHGEVGPGGGFQGGIMLASGFILYGMVFSGEEMRRVVPRRLTDALSCIGVLLYASVGVYSLLTGYNFLDYTPLKPGDHAGAESWGMTLVEYGVGITVTSVMITIFNEITEGTVSTSDGGR